MKRVDVVRGYSDDFRKGSPPEGPKGIQWRKRRFSTS
jgi:hypothetical protein